MFTLFEPLGSHMCLRFAYFDAKWASGVIKNIDVKQIGVRTRNSENSLVEKDLDWKPEYTLEEGLKNTFEWIRYNHDNGQSDIYDNKGSLEWWNK